MYLTTDSTIDNYNQINPQSSPITIMTQPHWPRKKKECMCDSNRWS